MLESICSRPCLPSFLPLPLHLPLILSRQPSPSFSLQCAFPAAVCNRYNPCGCTNCFLPTRRMYKKRQTCRRVAVDEEVDDLPADGMPVGEYGERIIVPSYEDGDGVGEIKLECDESGCVLVMPRFRSLAQEDVGRGYLSCDLTGCYFAEDPPLTKSFQVIEGEGWRIGYETAPNAENSFCAIVGAGGWSIALTASEFNDFCYLIQTLRKGISTMDKDGIIGKDDIVMQVEKGSVWMACSIPKKRLAILQNLWKLGSTGLLDSQQIAAFELRFILSGAGGKRQVTCETKTYDCDAQIFVLVRFSNILPKIRKQGISALFG